MSQKPKLGPVPYNPIHEERATLETLSEPMRGICKTCTANSGKVQITDWELRGFRYVDDGRSGYWCGVCGNRPHRSPDSSVGKQPELWSDA